MNRFLIEKYINLNLERNKVCNNKTNCICFVVTDLFFNYGGLEKTAINISNFLSTYYDVYILYIGKQKEKIKELLNPNIKLIEVKYDSNIFNLLKIRKILLDINPDCVIAMFSWHSVEYIPVILQNTGIPFIYSEHNDPKHILNNWNYINRNMILNLADLIRVQWDAWVEAEFLNKTFVIENGVEKIDKDIIYENKTILYVGRIEEKIKNTKELLEFIYNNDYGWKLKLYGNIFFNIDKYKNNKNIIFNNFTLDKDTIFNNVSFLCIPSIYEGFPNVVLESLSYGIPVLGNIECSGVNRLIINNNNGILYKNLYESLYNIILDENIMIDLRKNCKKSIEKYNVDVINNKWLSLIQKACLSKGNTVLDKWINY